jgi:small subunit ribosomal protein S15
MVSSITKLSKEGLGPSQIGMRLRDEQAVPLVKPVLGKSIKEVLLENKLQGPLPEDLSRLMERAAKLRTHLNAHHADRKNVRSLELLEAKIHRLSNYYKKTRELPSNWRYSALVAQLA